MPLYGYADFGPRTTPPPLPKYDPNVEAPKWNWSRIYWTPPVDKGPKKWTKIGEVPKNPEDPDWRGVIRKNVIELPVNEPQNLGLYQDPAYFWFDTPDYADPFKKMWSAFKIFADVGLLVATCVGWGRGYDFTVANNFLLFKRYCIPFVGAGMLSAATVVALANLRGKKDDYNNYVGASLVFSCVVGRKRYIDFVQAICVCTPIALSIKYCNEHNLPILPRFPIRKLTTSIGGQSAEHGIRDGDLRFGLRSNYGDPGRDVRTPYA